MSNGTSQALNSEQALASIPTAQGGLSRLAIARLKSAGVPVAPLLRRVGLTPEVIADPEERLSVRSQITLLDEVAIAPLIHADAYLNNLLMKYCEAALADRRGDMSQLRTRVENAISSFLPHGRVLIEDVARSLGMSERTLARKLADEGLNFTEILQQLRRDLAVCYLGDRKPQISKIAWLLGFNEVSAFTHTYKRWTGKTPSQMRTAAA